MQVLTVGKELLLKAEEYSLSFAGDRPYVYVDNCEGERLFELFVLSSVNSLHGLDDTTVAGSWQVNSLPGVVEFTIEAASSCWESKSYRFRCYSDRFTYDVTVCGSGSLTDVNYFGGYYSGYVRWGSGWFWSKCKLQRGFTPEPNSEEEPYFSPNSGAIIDLMGVPLPGRDDWFFTPPPFCFALEVKPGLWIGLGVESKPGANRFTEYRFCGQRGFHLSLSYEGHTKVRGSYQLPGIGFYFAPSEYEALGRHVQVLREQELVPRVAATERPDWWSEPIYCGWGSQCHVAAQESGAAPDYSRQELYEEFLAVIGEKGLDPGIVVIDDKWQLTYGENVVDPRKWPDLKGFIDQQHSQGRKVLLWLKAWAPEGLPADLCIQNAAGVAIACDPSNADYETLLRGSIQRMLSRTGYDADGFKIDFTARIPSGPSLAMKGDIWGLELMRRYLEIIYEEAKSAKADALIMTHTPHPYLADVLDMVRLNDMNKGTNILDAMRRRKQVATLACPEALIDTDNWPVSDRDSWRKYVKLQPDLGIPSLYFASHIDATAEPLTDVDYELVRMVWERWRCRK